MLFVGKLCKSDPKSREYNLFLKELVGRLTDPNESTRLSPNDYLNLILKYKYQVGPNIQVYVLVL